MSWGRVYLSECLLWVVRKTPLEFSIASKVLERAGLVESVTPG